jgi:dynein heavy chain
MAANRMQERAESGGDLSATLDARLYGGSGHFVSLSATAPRGKVGRGGSGTANLPPLSSRPKAKVRGKTKGGKHLPSSRAVHSRSSPMLAQSSSVGSLFASPGMPSMSATLAMPSMTSALGMDSGLLDGGGGSITSSPSQGIFEPGFSVFSGDSRADTRLFAQDERFPTFTESLQLDSRYLEEFVEGNFLYLRRKRGPEYTVYDLETVDHYKVDQQDFYTMSREGITHFIKDSQSEFSPLDHWEQEYYHFSKMRQIPFFKKYRLWKTFSVWKRNIAGHRILLAKESLLEGLFYLNKELAPPLMRLRSRCVEVASWRLIEMPKKGEVCGLDDFMSWQTKRRSKIIQDLRVFNEEVLVLMTAACDGVVDSFLYTHKIEASHKMTFMERASLRKECRLLTNYLRLADFLVVDTMFDFALNSMSDVAKNIAPAEWIGEPPSEEGSTASGDDNNAIFSVEVRFNHDGLDMYPSLGDFRKCMNELINDSMIVINSPQRLMEDASLFSFTQAGSEEGRVGSLASGDAISVQSMLQDDEYFVRVNSLIFTGLENAFDQVIEYADIFEPFKDIYLTNLEGINSMDQLETYENYELDTFSEVIAKYQGQESDFDTIPSESNVGIILVNSQAFKLKLLPSPMHCLMGIRNLIPALMNKKAEVVLKELNKLNPIASSSPQSPDEFVNKITTLEECTATRLPELKLAWQYISNMANLMEEQEQPWPVPDKQKEDMIMVDEGLRSLEAAVTRFEGEVEDETQRFAQEVQDSIPPMIKNILAVRERLDIAMISDADTPCDKVLEYLAVQQKEMDALKAQTALNQKHQQLLKQVVTEVEELDEVVTVLNLKQKLWKGLDTWQNLTTEWKDMPFKDVDAQEMGKQVTIHSKIASQAIRNLPGNMAAPLLKRKVADFEGALPVVVDLRNDTLQKRHWDKIHATLGFQIQGMDGFTLGQMIEKDVMAHAEEVGDITAAAQQEAVLEEMIAKVCCLTFTSTWLIYFSINSVVNVAAT